MTARQLPHSEESEQMVLGAMINDPKAIPAAMSRLGAGDWFHDLRHQAIYHTISKMVESGRPVELVTLQSALKDTNQLEGVGGITYLMALSDASFSSANLDYFLDSMKGKFLLRKLAEVCSEGKITALSCATYEEASEKVEKGILSVIREAQGVEKKTTRELVGDALAFFEACMAGGGKMLGISTGYYDLDRMTGGLQNSDMIVVAARPGCGKTSLLMNILDHIAVNQKIPVGVFSLEMSKEQIIRRAICSRARVNMRDLVAGVITPQEMKTMASSATAISASPLHVNDDPGLTIMQLRAKARMMVQEHGVKVIGIDYLQLLHSNQAGGKQHNRQQEVAEISNGIKSLAKELNVPILVLAQLNREWEKNKNRKPMLSDLRESGAIEQDADIVGTLFPKCTDEEMADSGTDVQMGLSILKQRNGPTGDIDLLFRRRITRYESVSRVAPPS